ncbi:MAG: hypothetical protein JO011_03240 [Ktedonobacteraceae bacterium]|nr:hypothetical protein [Ktedonobacteraceae bacterium]
MMCVGDCGATDGLVKGTPTPLGTGVWARRGLVERRPYTIILNVGVGTGRAS